MNYETAQTLTDIRFKRLVGVRRETFLTMVSILKEDYQTLHSRGGRKPKLSIENLLLATLQYLREYRTYEVIALEFGINESNLIRRSHWVENTLIQHGFSISKYEIQKGVSILDATEICIERPKKNK